MRLPIAAALIIFAANGQSQAQTAPNRGPMQDAIANLLDPIHWADVSEMDVAGVRIGMTPSDARAALIAKGFKPRVADATMASWSALIAQGAGNRGREARDYSTVSMFTMANGPQGEHIEVWYAASPQGARVASVKYSIPADRMTDEEFATSVRSKYGKPSFVVSRKLVYCSRTRDIRSSCLQLGDVLDRSGLLAVSDYSLHTISFGEGPDAAKERKARLAEAIEAAAPKNAKPSF